MKIYLSYLIRVYSAIIPRLLIVSLCNLTFIDPTGLIRRVISLRTAAFIWANINQPLNKFYAYLWGKNGIWHSSDEIDHWPQVLQ